MKLNRRKFLQSLGLGTLSLTIVPDITRGPIGKMFPLLIPAEEIIPGTPYWYASTCRECPVGCGVMLKVRDGNVIKIEGNPNHPINQGGLCPRGQAALQELYHADRLRTPLHISPQGVKTEVEWDRAFQKIQSQIRQGRTVFLTGKLSGSQRVLVEKWLRLMGNSSLVEYEPFIRLSYIKANQILFNKSVPSVYHLDKADYVLSFGADFLETWESPVGLSRDFSQARRFNNGKSAKLTYIGIADSLTAANADEEYKINPGSEAVIMLALGKWFLENSDQPEMGAAEKKLWLRSLSKFTLEKAIELSGLSRETLIHLGEELIKYKNVLVLCGDSLAVHETSTHAKVAANILNYICDAYGKTISLGRENRNKYNWSVGDFEVFIRSMEAGKIDNIIIYHTNPLYTFPDIERLRAAFQKVSLKVALVTTMNETTAVADVVLPVHHTIETWGMDEPEKGIYSVVQPGMTPLYGSKAMEEILLALGGSSFFRGGVEKFLKSQWSRVFRRFGLAKPYETNWKETLLKGGVWRQSKSKLRKPYLSPRVHSYLRNFRLPLQHAGVTLAVNYSQRFFDGRGANKSWLWEMPDPLHHMVWDIPLRIHPQLAKKHNLKEGDIVSISANDKSMEAPVLITEGVHVSVVAMEMGAGHEAYGSIAIKETGNPIRLLPTHTDVLSGDAVLLANDVQLKKTGKRRPLIRLQGNYHQQSRDIIRQIPLAEAIKLAERNVKQKTIHRAEIYPAHKHEIYDWTMVIDLSACNGCGACVVACYAENNVPVVGKQQCEKGREMAWLRIERFVINGRSRFIPMMCQHCEQAPCEAVCPVYASVHNSEGLNVQVYNRCIGARYCSNNCPYKVRRFNYSSPQWLAPADRSLNPDVSRRPQGVMEKCTFCIQRLRKAKEDAKMEGRLVRDGEVMPACAQSCPPQAITFGNLNDPESKVARLVSDFRCYTVFDHLDTKPSVIYLKGVKHG